MGSSTIQKVNKKIEGMSNTINQLDPRDIYGMFYPTTAIYTFFSSANRTLFRINYLFSHNTSFNKSLKIEIVERIFSDHSGMKAVIFFNNRRKFGKSANCKVNNTVLNNQWVKKQITR